MSTGAEMIQRKIWSDLSPDAGQKNLTAVQAAVGILGEVFPRALLLHLCGVDRACMPIKHLMPAFEFVVRKI